ncbi:MAG TPA: zf-HC2 domain-containing protein [Acidimicrobiales bacterium]
MRCAELREAAPDVALGLLTGEERAAALAHLERCEACRAEVASLAGTADELLLVAPEAAPPPGFADRVLAGLVAVRGGGSGLPADPAPSAASAPPGPPVGSPRPPGRRRGRRLSLAALAAAAVAVVVAGSVTVLGPATPPSTVAVADIRTGKGDVVGEATLRGGDDALVVVDVPAWDALVDKWGDTPEGSYWLAVEQDDGTRTLQPLPPGDEDWTVRVDAPPADVASVSMLDHEGRVWCTGRFEMQG